VNRLFDRLKIVKRNLALGNAIQKVTPKGRGKLENRIFDNGVSPENRSYQILSCLVFPCGILFAHETAGSTFEVFLSVRFSKHPELGELD